MSNAATYKSVMAAIAAGEAVKHEDFDVAVDYAKSAKRKAPKEEGTVFALMGAAKRPASDKIVVKAASGDKPVEKATTAKAEKPKTCSRKDCDAAYYSKGECSKHYAQTRRQDPIERAKANQASKDYYARQRA